MVKCLLSIAVLAMSATGLCAAPVRIIFESLTCNLPPENKWICYNQESLILTAIEYGDGVELTPTWSLDRLRKAIAIRKKNGETTNYRADLLRGTGSDIYIVAVLQQRKDDITSYLRFEGEGRNHKVSLGIGKLRIGSDWDLQVKGKVSASLAQTKDTIRQIFNATGGREPAALYPETEESYKLYGQGQLLREKQPSESMALLQRARAASPKWFSVRRAIAFAGLKDRKKNEVYEGYSALLEWLGSQGMSKSRQAAMVESWIGENFASDGDREAAADHFVRAAELLKEGGYKDQAARSNLLHRAGYQYDLMDRSVQALPLYLEAQAERERLGMKESMDYALTEHNAAYIYDRQNQISKAEKMYLEARSIRENIGGDYTDAQCSTLNHLGFFRMMDGKFEEAKELFAKSKDILEKLEKKNSTTYNFAVQMLRKAEKKDNSGVSNEPLKRTMNPETPDASSP